MKILLFGPNSLHLKKFKNLVQSTDYQFLTVIGPTLKQDWFSDSDPNTHKKIDLGYRPITRFWRGVRALERLILDYKPDILHVHQANVYAIAATQACKRTKTPMVLTAWGSDVLVSPNENYLLRLLVRRAIQNAQAIIAESDTLIQVMKSIAGETAPPFYKINFGTSLPELSAASKEFLVFSNRVHESNYRIDRVIHFFNTWVANFPEEPWRLAIGGAGSLTSDLRHLVSSLGLEGRVDFLGWLDRDTNQDFYQKAALYVSFPENDSISISVLEAMGHGCVPILSDIPSNHELVLDGVNGFIGHTEVARTAERYRAMDKNLVTAFNRMAVVALADPQSCQQRFRGVYQDLLGR